MNLYKKFASTLQLNDNDKVHCMSERSQTIHSPLYILINI